MNKKGWLGIFLGVPFAGFVVSCLAIVFWGWNCSVLTDGVPLQIGILMGYLLFASERGFMRLPTAIGQIRGWCLVMLCALAVGQISLLHLRMCREVAMYVSVPCPPEGLPPVIVSPAYFLCCSPTVFVSYWRVLQMVLTGISVVVAVKLAVWILPRLPSVFRKFWQSVSPGWSWLSGSCFVLLVVLSFFIEPFIHVGIMEPLKADAEGIAEIDDLVRRHDVIRAGHGELPNKKLDPERTRKHLLMLYAKYGACCDPYWEHISCAELAKLTSNDREILTGILKDWNRKRALALLEKTWL